jgi:hypothetical protein
VAPVRYDNDGQDAGSPTYWSVLKDHVPNMSAALVYGILWAILRQLPAAEQRTCVACVHVDIVCESCVDECDKGRNA